MRHFKIKADLREKLNKIYSTKPNVVSKLRNIHEKNIENTDRQDKSLKLNARL